MFVLLLFVAILPILFGFATILFFKKTPLTLSLFLFFASGTLWQIDVAVLYAAPFISESMIGILFRAFRLGIILFVPTLFYVSSIAVKPERLSWLGKLLLHKVTVLIIFLWSVLVYASNWTSHGIQSFEFVQALGQTFLFPVYGPMQVLVYIHMVLFLIGIVISFSVVKKIEDPYIQKLYFWIVVSVFLAFTVGILNFNKEMALIPTTIGIMLFSVVLFLTFQKMHARIVQGLHDEALRKEKLQHLNISTSGLIHEIRNPLAVIQGFAEILPMSENFTKEGRTMFAQIVSSTKHLKGVVDGFSEFIQSGKMNVKYIPLGKVVWEAVQIVSPIGAERDITTVYYDPKRAYMIYGDADKLRQVFINIIKNGIDAIASNAKTRRVEVKIKKYREHLYVDVKDTGEGIPEEKREKIFAPFTTTKSDGMGLGLAIVNQIILAHGGDIFILDTSDKGTTFRIVLPLKGRQND